MMSRMAAPDALRFVEAGNRQTGGDCGRHVDKSGQVEHNDSVDNGKAPGFEGPSFAGDL